MRYIRELKTDEAWRILTDIIVGFKKLMFDNVTDRKYRLNICQEMSRPIILSATWLINFQISEGVRDTHSDDTASLKTGILRWLNEDISVQLNPPIPSNEERAFRGWNHPSCARHLLPLSFSDNTQYILSLPTAVVPS